MRNTRFAVVCALGSLADNRAVEPLIGTLNDESPHVRGAAAGVLGAMGDARAVQPRVDALHDEVASVRSHAAKALHTIAMSPQDGG